MAPTARSRLAASSGTAHQPAILPSYQPLSHPLNPTAIHALHALPQTHSLTHLKTHFQTSTNHLAEITGDLNDQHTFKAASHARQAVRRKADASWDNGEADRRLDDAWQEVQMLTDKMEESTRHVIDARARVEYLETALRELDSEAASAAAGATQGSLGNSIPSRSQRSKRQRAQSPTSLSGSDSESPPLPPSAPTSTLNQKLSSFAADYNTLSLHDRYASHNTYISF
ncbi:MAG: hypothetical protein Q9190_002394, partial [Brigantiaea leucoxantha]